MGEELMGEAKLLLNASKDVWIENLAEDDVRVIVTYTDDKILITISSERK